MDLHPHARRDYSQRGHPRDHPADYPRPGLLCRRAGAPAQRDADVPQTDAAQNAEEKPAAARWGEQGGAGGRLGGLVAPCAWASSMRMGASHTTCERAAGHAAPPSPSGGRGEEGQHGTMHAHTHAVRTGLAIVASTSNNNAVILTNVLLKPTCCLPAGRWTDYVNELGGNPRHSVRACVCLGLEGCVAASSTGIAGACGCEQRCTLIAAIGCMVDGWAGRPLGGTRCACVCACVRAFLCLCVWSI
jgi:hypothetical protein